MNNDIKFDLNDITIVPAVFSEIDSRKLVKINFDNGTLPIIVAPMDTVIDDENVKLFKDNNLVTCSVRKDKSFLVSSLYDFIGLSLTQFESLVSDPSDDYVLSNKGFLVDIASGNLLKLYNLVIEFKKKYPNIPLMIGNIANPETYREYCKILTNIDFIRCSVGSGTVCTTGSNTGIYYPMGSLIKECYDISVTVNQKRNKESDDIILKKYTPKIIADGGFKNFDDIIKALNLGADYVMLGGILAKTLEACGEVYCEDFRFPGDPYHLEKIKIDPSYDHTKIPNNKKIDYFLKGFNLTRKYRGMSTKEVQKSLGKEKLTTSEGISKRVHIEYTLTGWIENFDSYLRSAMAYSNCLTLDDFIGKQNYVHISEQAIQRYKK